MAGQNEAEEFISVDGIVATGEHGTAVAPTSATGDLGVTWTDHGLTTAAGVTRSQPVTRTTRRAWQNNKKLRTLTTEAAVRFQFILVQTTAEIVELWNGVALTAGSIVTDPGREWPLIAFDLDLLDSESADDDVIREYAPSARVVEVGDQVALAGDGRGWPITVEAEYDTALGGYTKQFFSKFESPVNPVISTVLPSGAAATEMVTITGSGFTGATSVKFGATEATDFIVGSDQEIFASLPTGSAGSAAVTVTTPVATSAAKAYTRA